MSYRCSLFISNNEIDSDLVGSKINFIVNEIFWNTDHQKSDCLYRQLIYKILSLPRNLIFHLQRIYFTNINNRSEQIYAALVDLWSVLHGNIKGKTLCSSVMTATSALLTEQQRNLLDIYLTEGNMPVLSANQFSISSTGVIGLAQFITGYEQQVGGHDPLYVSRGNIEYSLLGAGDGNHGKCTARHTWNFINKQGIPLLI